MMHTSAVFFDMSGAFAGVFSLGILDLSFLYNYLAAFSLIICPGNNNPIRALIIKKKKLRYGT